MSQLFLDKVQETQTVPHTWYLTVFLLSRVAFDTYKITLCSFSIFFSQPNNDEYWYFPKNTEIIWMKK